MSTTQDLTIVDGIDYLLVKQTQRGRANLGLVPGEWTQEPDNAHWIDPASDLDCLIVRSRTGALCGYVAVPPEHPLYGKGYLEPGVDVHGGLTYADFCAEGSEDGICHVPAAGRPHKVWWFGFDCAHYMDKSPRDFDPAYKWGNEEGYYRNVAYVTDEIRSLAQQLAAVSA